MQKTTPPSGSSRRPDQAAMPPDARAHGLSMTAFACLSLTPLLLLLFGAFMGGAVLWTSFAYMTVFGLVLDKIVPMVRGDATQGQEFPGANILLGLIGFGALLVLGLVTFALAGGLNLSLLEKIILFFAAGFWLGQVGHPAAHELIHRQNRGLFNLGQLFYGAILFGQHASAHRLVHHVFVATDLDPNSAHEGESIYRFMPRAWIGSFTAGLTAENRLRARKRKRLHPYVIYLLTGAAAAALCGLFAGALGVIFWILLSLHVQMQILVSDYVQHYGLRRIQLPNGAFEPVNARHSWNSGQWFSSGVMLNAPRHSDHHAHPARPYPALRLEDEAPRLPWALPLACTIAFWPSRFMRRMKAPLMAVKQGVHS